MNKIIANTNFEEMFKTFSEKITVDEIVLIFKKAIEEIKKIEIETGEKIETAALIVRVQISDDEYKDFNFCDLSDLI